MFLRLNGIAVPVSLDSATVNQKDIGSEKIAEDGTPLFNRRATKRTWAVSTTIRSAEEALAWRDLVTGKGHVLNFNNNNLYTSKGQPPATVGGGFTVTATLPKFGAYRAAATAANTATWVVFTATSAWTVMLWHTLDGGTTWSRWVIRSDGAKWLDGVVSVAATTFMGVASGVLTLGSASAGGFDDVVCLPFLVPTDWPAQDYAFGYAFGPLPRLTVDGAFIEASAAGGISVKCKVGTLKGFVANGTKNAQDFSFELTEV